MPDPTAGLAVAERRLQAAMRAGDVAELDALLDDRLVATIAPGVELVTKAQDLESHRSRQLVLTSLVEEALTVVVVGRTGVTRLVAALTGRASDVPFEVRMVYTRTWVLDDGGSWRVIAAHISST